VVAIANADFTSLSGISVLELADGNNVVDAGTNAVTAGIATIVGGSGNDSVQVADLGSFNSLVGGGGTDTVSLSDNTVVAIANADFTSLSGISVLELADGNNVVDAGTNAVAAGIATIVGGSGNDSVQVADLGSFNSLVGGGGTDTVSLSDNTVVAIANADFTSLSGISVLELADGNNVVDAGTNAVTAGIATIVGGSGNDSLDASGATAGFYLSGGSAGNDTFVGSAFNDTIAGNGGTDSIVTGNGDNLVIFATSAELFSAATVAGGTGDDTLSFTTQGQALIDGDFIHVDNVEAIQFADGMGSSAVLAGTANTAGISSLFGGTGNDSLTVDSTIYTAPTFDGSAGTDVLSLSNDTAVLTNAFFLNLSSVESFITANGNNDITVGNNGILSITGGTGDDILNAAARTTGVTLLGGLGEDTLTGGSGGSRQQGWGGISTANVSEDTLTGGAGTDVFVLGSAAGNAYGLDSNPALNKNAEITGFAMTTDIFELSLNGQSGGVTVAADSVIANQVNVSVGGLEVYRVNYDDATDAATLYISGTTNVVAQLTGFTGSGANLSTSNFNLV
jgi:Ca2+-binding RTX toxin-like protein